MGYDKRRLRNYAVEYLNLSNETALRLNNIVVIIMLQCDKEVCLYLQLLQNARQFSFHNQNSELQ